MSVNTNRSRPDRAPRVAIVASNPAVSAQTGWPIGFWWAELTHPYWEFVQAGVQVDIASPDGGLLQGDGYSDPRDPSGYSAEDLISMGFLNSPQHMALIENSKPLADIDVADYDGVLLVGGQGPMYTFYGNDHVSALARQVFEADKVLGVICHATSILLKTTLSDGRLLVTGRTWTGFADSEEQYADEFAGTKIQPFWIEEEARKLPDTNFVVGGRFWSHVVRDGLLVTGQQQYSGAAAARAMLEVIGA